MGSRENVVRVALALLVLAVVAALIINDRSSPDPTPSEPGNAQSSTLTPTASPTAEPTPTLPIPTPPPGLEELVCKHLNRPVDLRVLTFNIHRATGTLEVVAKEIEEIGADVVLLQELDRNMIRSGQVDQAAWLAERLDMSVDFSVNLRRAGGAYGTAILSRHEILNNGTISLPNAGDAEPRGLQWVTLDVAGQPVRVYNTHLQSIGPAIRSAQARHVAGVIAQDPLPVLLGGDFNDEPGTTPLRLIDEVLTDTWTVGEGSSLTGRTRKIDYIYSSSRFVPLLSRTARSGASDHHRLWTNLRLTPADTCTEGPKGS